MKRIAFVLTFALALAAPTFATSTSQPEHLSKKQLAALIATARTPAEHRRIADYYRTQSDKLMAESNHHAAMAAEFRANPATNNHKSAYGTVNHCEYLAQSFKAKAEEDLALAREHERMAQAAEQN
jgi:hypothetical protein